jgi:poly(ribitol-phosphate) beta-N-acetylglucosaminyltransferase
MLNSEVQVPVKVSVVVPVYNPGEHITASVNSLLTQSMPADELELIFVDDGSTDETPALLDRLAQAHAHLQVIHEPPSGWPGRPRNVGVDRATGEYVMFLDQDDWLGDEALERMYAMARRNESDIVIGKMVGIRRNVPVVLFNSSRDRATIHDSLIIDSLTPHKMFRREFLVESGLRFPEGRRRLEDHVFVVAAYFAAKNVSVLADYPCYYHISRPDHGNAGFQRLDPPSYLAYLAEALDVVDANTEPGRARDRLHRRWLRVELVGRLRGRKLLAGPDDFREEFTREAGQLAEARFAPGVDAGLSPLDRLVARLMRDRDVSSLVRLAKWEGGLTVSAQLDSARPGDGHLALDVSAELLDDNGDPVVVRLRDGARVLAPALPPEVLDRVPDDVLDLGNAPHSLDLFVRKVGDGTQEFLAGRSTPEDARLSATTTARLVVATAAGGSTAPLSDGVWQVLAQWRGLDWTLNTHVRTPPRGKRQFDRLDGPAVLGQPPRLAVPHRGAKRRLRVELTGTGSVPTVTRTLNVDREHSQAAGRRPLRLDLVLQIATDRPRDIAVTATHPVSGQTRSWPGRLAPQPESPGQPARSRLTVEVVGPRRLAAGQWSLALSPLGGDDRLALSWPLVAGRGGSVRLAPGPARSVKARTVAALPPAVARGLRRARRMWS